MKLFQLLPEFLSFIFGLYILLDDPGANTYSFFAIVSFLILMAGCLRRKAILQPFNFFCIFFFFYNFSSHFLFELSGLSVLGAFHSNANRENIVKQALIAYCFLVACSPFLSNGKGTTREVILSRLSYIRDGLVPKRLLIISFVTFFLTFAVFLPILPIVIQNGVVDRVLSSSYINSNLWVSVGLLSYVGSFLSILAMTNNRNYALIALVIFGSYFVMDMAIGGRKILFYLVLTVAPWMWASRAFRLKHLGFAGAAVLLPIIMRAVIDKVDLVERDLAGIAAGIFGEFLFTSGTGYIIDANYQAICRNVDISSYFYWLIYMIPRAVYESKPYSLAMDFANYMDMGMGFALTPVAEAYCVGHQTAWIFLLCSTLVIFSLVSLASRRSVIVYLIAMALCMDMNRGEFSYTVVQIVTMFVVYKFFIRLASKRQSKKPSHESGSYIERDLPEGRTSS